MKNEDCVEVVIATDFEREVLRERFDNDVFPWSEVTSQYDAPIGRITYLSILGQPFAFVDPAMAYAHVVQELERRGKKPIGPRAFDQALQRLLTTFRYHSCCGQYNAGQDGSYPCLTCGLPTVWSASPENKVRRLLCRNMAQPTSNHPLIEKILKVLGEK